MPASASDRRRFTGVMLRAAAPLTVITAIAGGAAFMLLRPVLSATLDPFIVGMIAVFAAVVLPLAIGSIAALRARRAAVLRSRYHAGHCPACGYDLRAQFASRKQDSLAAHPIQCPECGHTPSLSSPSYPIIPA